MNPRLGSALLHVRCEADSAMCGSELSSFFVKINLIVQQVKFKLLQSVPFVMDCNSVPPLLLPGV